MKIKLFTNLKKRHNRNTTPNLVSGFTIIEALVAIFILTISISSMLGVTASSISFAKYADNEIVSNYLLQEAVDYIRNDRDTIAFQMKDDPSGGWNNFLTKYNSCLTNLCDIKVNESHSVKPPYNDVLSCGNAGCEALYYIKDNANVSNPNFFYSHDGSGVLSNFTRSIKMEKIIVNGIPNDNQIKITVTLDWKNGAGSKSQTLVSYLLNWQQ